MEYYQNTAMLYLAIGYNERYLLADVVWVGTANRPRAWAHSVAFYRDGDAGVAVVPPTSLGAERV